MDDVRTWLSKLGLSPYADAFEHNDVAPDLLTTLTDQDLRELGVQSLGHRKMLLKAIGELDRGESRAVAPTANAASGAAHRRPRRRGRNRRRTPPADGDVLRPGGLDGIVWTAGGTRRSCATSSAPTRSPQLGSSRASGAALLAQYLGDGLLVYFGHPVAHEDDARPGAVRAGLGIISAMRDHGTRLTDDPSARLAAAHRHPYGRGGGRRGRWGDTTRAAGARRYAQPGCPTAVAGRPDTVVISDRTRQLAGGDFGLRTWAASPSRASSLPPQAWRTPGERSHQPLRGRCPIGLSPLVGREQEIGLLMERWQLAQEGEGQVVLLSGEPGIGKSRIVNALRARLEAQVMGTLRFQCSPYYVNSAL